MFQNYYLNESDCWARTLSPGSLSSWTLPAPVDVTPGSIKDGEIVSPYSLRSNSSFSTFGKKAGRMLMEEFNQVADQMEAGSGYVSQHHMELKCRLLLLLIKKKKDLSAIS